MGNTWLIFGKVPPPHGGVTISVLNLINSLKFHGYNVVLANFRSLCTVKKYSVSHINYSKPLFRCLAVLLGRLFSKKVVFVVHGEKFDKSNLWNIISLKFVNHVQVLNDTAFKQVSDDKAFLCPPIFKEGMEKEKFKSNGDEERDILFYISSGNKKDIYSIYGVDYIAEIVDRIHHRFLITIIDVSGEFRDTKQFRYSSVKYIGEGVDFISKLACHKLYIRPTRTDGNSVAILESLVCGTPVLASDCVKRPDGVITYDFSDLTSLEEIIEQAHNSIPSVNIPSVTYLMESITDGNLSDEIK
ncbi:hypothetical protein [uncultured Ferrimonas sp.]|uniref:hypothetical protein n=1 Tax=uncultured Ferrimonas sp. TaxID=432640 RepID=UPI00263518E2|nr:hypothetical protein [uncultured Ferrimonas sp.]